MSGDPNPEATELRRQKKDLREEKKSFRLKLERMRAAYSAAWDVVLAYKKAPEMAASNVQKLEQALRASDQFWES